LPATFKTLHYSPADVAGVQENDGEVVIFSLTVQNEMSPCSLHLQWGQPSSPRLLEANKPCVNTFSTFYNIIITNMWCSVAIYLSIYLSLYFSHY